VKFLLKEDFVPAHVNKPYFWLAPCLAMIPSLVVLACNSSSAARCSVSRWWSQILTSASSFILCRRKRWRLRNCARRLVFELEVPVSSEVFAVRRR
jgi:hypothetical protein